MTKILVDSSDINKIKNIDLYYKISGITTNPSIIAKECKDLKERLQDIKKFVGNRYEIHVQTTERDADLIFNEAVKLKKFFGDKFFIKIPISKQGLQAAIRCKNNGINVTMTAIFTPMQVLACSSAGVDYVAPYVNRIDNVSGNSIEILKYMQNIVKDTNTKILAASFKNQNQITNVVSIGVDSITVSPNLIEESIWHPYTDKSVEQFELDWKEIFKNKKVTDYL